MEYLEKLVKSLYTEGAILELAKKLNNDKDVDAFFNFSWLGVIRR